MEDFGLMPPQDLIPTSGSSFPGGFDEAKLKAAWDRDRSKSREDAEESSGPPSLPVSFRLPAAGEPEEGGAGEGGPGDERLRPLTEQERYGDMGVSGVFPRYRTGDPGPKTRILLVAGSTNDPSYLQEIVDLRAHWLEMGHEADEIACYFVVPDEAQYREHRAQWAKLAPQTEGFFLASPHVVFRHLERVAGQEPADIFIYVCGEGEAPASESDQDRKVAYLRTNHPEMVSHHRIEMRGGPSGHMNDRMRLEALRDGLPARKLLFTATDFSEAMAAFPDRTRKVVILQGDYAGGFVDGGASYVGLASVPNLTVLTSAAGDRRSFPDYRSGNRSMFGSVLMRGLGGRPAKLADQDWKEVAADVMADVEELEKAQEVAEAERSLPVYYRSGAR